jgi:hypothetical protein
MRADHHGSHEGKASGIITVLLGVAAIALAGMAGTIGLIRSVGELGAKVGDIVSFDSRDPISHDVRARISAIPADNLPGVACVLDVQAMHAGGGSVIVESRQFLNDYGIRVHWAGAQSAPDGASCGTSADLLVNAEDLETLAMAAGGFGTSASKYAHSSLLGLAAAEQ